MRLPYNGYFEVTQLFGENPASYAKFGLKGHNGIDFGIPTGTPILSPHSGVIKEAYFDPSGYGWYVKIENSVEGSVLGHFLSISVPIGKSVGEGDQVALSDNTGYSTGSHLHWGYYKFPRDRSNGYNGFINQYDLIKNLLVKEDMMQIGKKVFAELIAKADSQERLINQMKTDFTSNLAKKEQECQQKVKNLRAEVNKKLADLAGQYA